MKHAYICLETKFPSADTWYNRSLRDVDNDTETQALWLPILERSFANAIRYR